MSSIRSYKDSDYEAVKVLYRHSEWFGGQFDEARDSRAKLSKIISNDPEAIFVSEEDNQLNGTISLIEDGRVAWLFRFAVKNNDPAISRQLYEKAVKVFKSRGHSQIIVYSPIRQEDFDKRYIGLGMTKGNDFTAYWAEI